MGLLKKSRVMYSTSSDDVDDTKCCETDLCHCTPVCACRCKRCICGSFIRARVYPEK